MKLRTFILTISAFIGAALLNPSLAQEKTDKKKDKDKGITEQLKEEDRWTSQFQWRILLPVMNPESNPEQYPLKNFNTKTIFFSIGRSFPISRFLQFQAHPGFSFTKLRYEQIQQKVFPTPGNKIYAYEKVRGYYFTIPVGFQFNLVRDRQDDIALKAEVGASAGVLIGSSYKTKLKKNQPNSNIKDHDIKMKVKGVSGISDFRYGAYTRINYKFFGVTAYYRLSDYFELDQTYTHNTQSGLPQNADSDTGNEYPQLPPIELGITVDF